MLAGEAVSQHLFSKSDTQMRKFSLVFLISSTNTSKVEVELGLVTGSMFTKLT